MKKILFFLAVAMATITTQAQSIIPFYGSNTAAQYDTLTNANTVYFTCAANALSANRSSNYAIQFKATNLSGTSTFKVILQGTIDGTNWTNVHQIAGTDGIHCDTLQVTSLSPATWIFRINPLVNKTPTSSTYLSTNAGKFRRLRVAFVGTGTQSTRIYPVYGINE